MVRLRRSDPSKAGIQRVREGSGFRYVFADGVPVDDAELRTRIDAIVIPPAWQDVWICPHANGHIQAIGTDAAGRRQYRYHEEWRRKRDLEKFDHVLTVAAALPQLRARIDADMRTDGLNRDRVLACAARLLDVGFFRIGSEEYAETNGSFGLATIRREDTTIDGRFVVFDYRAKSGKRFRRPLPGDLVAGVIDELLTREDDPNPELLAFWDPEPGDDGRPVGWTDVKSWDINGYLERISPAGVDITAKDFRTWSATVLCSVALGISEEAVTSPTAVKRAITRAVEETSRYLNNTPAVCRSSYIHPRVIDLFAGGVTIADELPNLGADDRHGQLAYQGPVETAVLEMLSNPQASRAARRKQRLLEAASARGRRGGAAKKQPTSPRSRVAA